MNEVEKEKTNPETKQSGGSNLSAYPASEGEKLESLYKIAIIGIVIAICVLAFNIWQNNSLHTRITELEKDIAQYKIEIYEKIFLYQKEYDNNSLFLTGEINNIKKTNECLKQKRYWQYEQCFK